MSLLDKYKQCQVIGWWKSNRIILNANPINHINDNELIINNLNKSMISMKSFAISNDGITINYSGLKDSEVYKDYLLSVGALIFLKLSDLSINQLKSFFINLYNYLIIHSLIENLLDSFPGGILSRLKLYATVSYIVDGLPFSLNEIEHGVLRGNRPMKSITTNNPFDLNDERIKYIVDNDPRIHFTLNCGALSCPPIAFYQSNELDRQLDISTKLFINNNVSIRTNRFDSNTIMTLSEIFKWYREDFGKSDEEIIRWIDKYIDVNLPDYSNVVICYDTYNWAKNNI